MSAAPHDDVPTARERRWIEKLVDLRPGEGALLAWSCAFFFFLLYSYSLVKPVREALGISGGAANLPNYFTGTLVLMAIVTPLYALLVTKLPRRRFIPIAYRIAMAVMFAFWIALRTIGDQNKVAVGFAFFAWVSVFNLMIVSVFRSFMADVWTFEQAKRLFGFVGIGGTVGSIVGAASTDWMARRLGAPACLLVSIAGIECAVFCVRRIARLRALPDTPDETHRESAPSMWSGFRLVASQPYLRAIAAYMVLYALVGSYLYFQKGFLVESALSSRDERTALFARIDVLAQTGTLVVQVFLTGRLIRWFGVTFALVSQPVIATLGWLVLGAMIRAAPSFAEHGTLWLGLPPALAVLIAVEVTLRTSNFATAVPARESLYTVVSRDVKYKSKNFIDTMLYRVADFGGAQSFSGLRAHDVGLAALALVPVPLSIVWIGVGVWLGRRQREMTAAREVREAA